MSRNKDRILKTLAKYNLKPLEINWKPLGISFEMCGPEGGWFVRTDEDIYMAYNIKELINIIETKHGHYTDIGMIRKYCNHIWCYKDGYDHSKGSECAVCKIEYQDKK